MRVRSVVPASLAALGVLPALVLPARAGEQQEPASSPVPSPLPWMVTYSATDKAPIGVDVPELKKWIEKTHKNVWSTTLGVKNKTAWEKIWNETLLLQTPAWTAEVPAFSLGRYEVTNAQWERFLQDRMDAYVTKQDDTLESVAQALWRVTEGAEVQRGWKILLRANGDALQPILNPTKDEKWDPLMTRAASQKLPAGLELRYARYMQPGHWDKDGSLPDAERKRPMRSVSWEQAMDFCAWAGFHLPTEFEWERAARGLEGRWFPWGTDWNPLHVIWRGYNEAAIKAKLPEFPPVTRNADEAPPSEVPGPVDVDALAQGATPEGVHHLLGNVSELTSSRASPYPKTTTTNSFRNDTSVIVARGGNFEDRAELLTAPDRNIESQQGVLLPSHRVANYGFRLAAYPVAGADLMLPVAQRWNETRDLQTPANWLPVPLGFEKRDDKGAELFAGFQLDRTAGFVERKLASESPDHVFVTGAASSVAFLPIRGVALEHVKTSTDLKRLAVPERTTVIGILAGTPDASFEVLATPEGKTEPETVRVSFADPRFSRATDERHQTQEMLGAVVAVEGDRVLLFQPNDTLSGAPKWRTGLIGALAAPIEVLPAKGIEAPAAAWADGTLVLSTTIPQLDAKGRFPNNGASLRVTLRVPVARGGKVRMDGTR